MLHLLRDGNGRFRAGRFTRSEMGLVGADHDIAARTVHFGELVRLDGLDRYRVPVPGMAA